MHNTYLQGHAVDRGQAESVRNETHLNRLASIVLLVDLIKDDAVVLVALGHVSPNCQIDELPKLFQNDLSPNKQLDIVTL